MARTNGTNGITRPAGVPLFLPDPELIGNLEGNDKLAKADAESARAYVEQAKASS